MRKIAEKPMNNLFLLLCSALVFGALVSWSQPGLSSCPGSNDTPPSTVTVYSGTANRDYIVVGWVQINWPGYGWIDAGIGVCRYDMDDSYNKGSFTYATYTSDSSKDVYYVKGGSSKDLVRWATSNYETCGTYSGWEYRIGKDVGSSFEGEPKKLYLMGESGDDKLYVCAYGGSSTCWINDTNPDCAVRYVASGGGDDDWVLGGYSDDYLLGDDGDDHMYGYGGDDCMYALAGTDYLDGGADTDYLDGGNGTDTCDCGSASNGGTADNCEGTILDCDDTGYPCVY